MKVELEQLSKILNSLMSMTIVHEDGRVYESRKLIDRVEGMKIEIYPNDHNPPHFHVRGPEVDAKFSIEDGSHLKGGISRNQLKKIQYFYQRMRPHLIREWNSLRPDDGVGKVI